MALHLLSALVGQKPVPSSRLQCDIRSSDEDEQEQLQVTVPRSFLHQTTTSESSHYQNCLQRIAQYRQSLFAELEKRDCDIKYAQFCESLQDALDEAKDSVSQLSDHLRETGKLGNINRHLLPRLASKEQHLKLYKLLHDVADAARTSEPLCESVKRDYKKLPIGTLLGKVSSIRQSYYRIVSAMNVLLRANIKANSPFYRYLYKQCEEGKCNLAELAEEIFVWSFELIQWPIISLENVYSRGKSTDKQRQLFTELFCCLLELQTGLFRLDASTAIEDNRLPQLNLFDQSEETVHFHVPIKLMAVPLIKRFKYHFLTANSKLNNIENPEWYLCQVEQWITRNEPFLASTVDPLLEVYFDGQCKSAKFQLTCHLLELVKTKLQHDAPQLEEDRLFSLTLDEVILFNKQINFLAPGIFEFSEDLNPIRVFFKHDSHFQRFLQLEKNRLNESIDSIFESDTLWNVVYGADYTEDTKFVICEAADRFSLLLVNLIERSMLIPLNHYQIRVVDLLLETVDDFRLRLSQLIHAYEERWSFTRKFYSILNTFAVLKAMVEGWASHSYFFQILADNGRDLSAFKAITRALEHMIEAIFERIENNIIADVTGDIIEYKKLNWHSMSIDSKQLTTSKAGANLIYNISVKCSTLRKVISSSLFHSFLYDIASKIQQLFFERIILEHYFNQDGARQLQHDIKEGLFSMFSLYIKNTEYTFSRLSDALLILNCSPVTCHDLQTRYKTASEIELKQALRNIGVYSLKPSTVMAVIEKRIGFT